MVAAKASLGIVTSEAGTEAQMHIARLYERPSWP